MAEEMNDINVPKSVLSLCINWHSLKEKMVKDEVDVSVNGINRCYLYSSYYS